MIDSAQLPSEGSCYELRLAFLIPKRVNETEQRDRKTNMKYEQQFTILAPVDHH